MAGQTIFLNVSFQVPIPVHLATVCISNALFSVITASQFVKKNLRRRGVLVENDQVRLLAGDGDVGGNGAASNVEVGEIGIDVDVAFLVVYDGLDNVL